MGIEALAAAIVGQILVPLLTKGADVVVDGLSSRIGESAADGVTGVAQRILARVTKVFGSAGEEDQLEQLKQRPEAAAPLVTAILKEQLEQDKSLAAELEAMLDEKPPQGGQSIGSIMADYVGVVDLRYAKVQDAQVIGQVVGTPPPGPQRERSQSEG